MHCKSELRDQLTELQKGSGSTRSKTPELPRTKREADQGTSPESESKGSSSESVSSVASTHTMQSQRRGATRPHPPGFREVSSRVSKFSGKPAEDGTFEVWLEDFEEATTDCGWRDKMRARWFSWFVSGPAKATRQRSLTSEQKADWKSIVKVFRGQYGVHLDPRTAYHRCNELRYDQFGSAKGLLNSMREYQRMAPERLSDSILESILWNKVPVELQQEVGEITDGSVQELLMKLLRAESVVAERKRRSQGAPNKLPSNRPFVKRSSDTGKKQDEEVKSNSLTLLRRS